MIPVKSVLFLVLLESAGAGFAQDDAASVLNRGVEKHQAGDLKGAMEDFSRAIDLDSGFALAYFDRGLIKNQQGNADGALIEFARAIELDPNFAPAYHERAGIEREQGVFDAAIADDTRAVEIDPKYTNAYMDRGIARLEQGDYQGAKTDYSHAIELEPDRALGYGNRGLAEFYQGDQEGALADCNRALEIDPKYAYAYVIRGRIRRRNGQMDAAVTEYSLAIEADPQEASAYLHRGCVKFQLRLWTEACQDLQSYSGLDPTNDEYARLFIWLAQTRRGEKALADRELTVFLDQKTKHSPPGKWVLLVAGHLLDKVSEHDLLAAAVSPDARTESGRFCEGWFYLGMKKLLAGVRPEAVDCFRKCLATARTDFIEYDSAESELKALGQEVPAISKSSR